VIPSLKVRGNRIYGIAKEGDVTVRTAEDIIRIAGDRSLPKTKLVNTFVLAPVYISERFSVLALSPVMSDETSETVANWYKEAVRMGSENYICIIGIGADGDSKFRKFFLDKYTKGKQWDNGLTLDYEGFDFSKTINLVHNCPPQSCSLTGGKMEESPFKHEEAATDGKKCHPY